MGHLDGKVFSHRRQMEGKCIREHADRALSVLQLFSAMLIFNGDCRRHMRRSRTSRRPLRAQDRGTGGRPLQEPAALALVGHLASCVKLAPSALLAALARIADSGNSLVRSQVPKTLMDSPEVLPHIGTTALNRLCSHEESTLATLVSGMPTQLKPLCRPYLFQCHFGPGVHLETLATA